MNEQGENLNDEALLLQYKNTQNKKIVGVLYKRYVHLVLGVCYKYLKNREESKDAVTQIFEKLFEELPKREIKNFKIWLTFVSKNFCISELRKKIVENERKKEYLNTPTEYEDSTEINQTEIRYEELKKAIEKLPENQMQCIRLFYFEQLSYNEVCTETGFTQNEVKSYIQNGKRNLKNLLKK